MGIEKTFVGLWKELRPRQWYKQIILFIPLVFSGLATEPGEWLRITGGATIFCVVSGCVYILNDIIDRETDRNHPIKRHRPIASGVVPLESAIVAMMVGFLLSGIIALQLQKLFLLVLIAYVLQNVVYSIFLKKLFLVDLFSISLGFVLRALAGVVLIDVALSPWLFLCVFLAAFMLASGKRRAELVNIHDESQRDSLEDATEQFSFFLLFISASILLVVYSLYTFFAQENLMMLTVPFAYYSVLRFNHLAITNPSEKVRTHLFQRDMIANFSLWGFATLIILYLIS